MSKFITLNSFSARNAFTNSVCHNSWHENKYTNVVLSFRVEQCKGEKRVLSSASLIFTFWIALTGNSSRYYKQEVPYHPFSVRRVSFLPVSACYNDPRDICHSSSTTTVAISSYKRNGFTVSEIDISPTFQTTYEMHVQSKNSTAFARIRSTIFTNGQRIPQLWLNQSATSARKDTKRSSYKVHIFVDLC